MPIIDRSANSLIPTTCQTAFFAGDLQRLAGAGPVWARACSVRSGSSEAASFWMPSAPYARGASRASAIDAISYVTSGLSRSSSSERANLQARARSSC